MSHVSISKKALTFVSMTVLALASHTTFTEARGVGVGQQSPSGQAPDVPTKSPLVAPAMPLPADDIIADHAHAEVIASEAAGLLDDLRLQLEAHPNAKLNIRWQLARPPEAD